MSEKLRWGILGAGSIARSFAKGVQNSQSGVLAAVGSRSQEKAETFGDEYSVPHRHGSYEALLSDETVDAVYIATPHPQHLEWIVKAAQAGKHILSEKPMTLNYAQAMIAVNAARENNVFLMEAFMYRCHPQVRRVRELIESGEIGEVKFIEASFGFNAPYNEGSADSRLYSLELGGGGILDVGCYPVSMARLLAGAAQGKPFADPTDVQAMGVLAPTGADAYAVAQLKFAGDVLAQVGTAVGLNMRNDVRVSGSEGHIVVSQPWVPSREGEATTLHIAGKNGERDETIEAGNALYALEADVVARAVFAGEKEAPEMSLSDTLGNIRVLDKWRELIGQRYPADTMEGQKQPLSGVALRKSSRPSAPMKYARVAGVEKDISRLVFGVTMDGSGGSEAHVTAQLDDFYERGGNAFDTAYIYGGGKAERTLGQWVRSRGLEDEAVLIMKGAHTPYCDPDSLTSQFAETMERAGLESTDFYFMHRDNTDIPAGEFVDALNREYSKGRIKAFGGSNWSIARIEEANEYARQNGLQGFSAVSNNFSLARMVKPVWDGCVAASDPDSRRWLEEHQFPVFAWSSQARGFFARASRDYLDDKELVNSWYSDDNFERFERVRQLGEKRHLSPFNIATAYVLHQPFPTFALVGPHNIEEMRTGIEALNVELSPQEVKWLNLEADSPE